MNIFRKIVEKNDWLKLAVSNHYVSNWLFNIPGVYMF